MTIPEVLDIFEDYTRKENIPFRCIDLERLCLIDIDTVKNAYRATIESISEADIERHTSYANQRREDVIRTMVKGVVKYAILSHTWFRSDSEFRYHDMVSDAPRMGPGWYKLERFCNLARGSFRCRFAWADTVCIDYRDPLDRQLGNQSLFDWYRNAYVCIAYLAGASDPSDMRNHAWFYRGFTLTELLAPMRMKFYGEGWKALNNDYVDNDKADRDFLELLSEASGIPAEDLRTFWPGPDRIRHKLSWASERETTAVEDKAYSLMAIFGSRIPINYGEQEKAFTRLMIDVIPKSGECDVFAWAGPCSRDHPGLPPSPTGFGKRYRDHPLSSSPHHYRLCGDRSLSIDLDHLHIRTIVLEVTLPSEGGTSYKPIPLRRSASVSEVTLLHWHSQDWAPFAEGNNHSSSPHHYRLCGDRSLSIDLDHLRIRTIVLEVTLLRWHSQDWAPLAGGNIQMAVGVVDYGWTGNPDEGILHQGNQYFCFLLHKSSKDGGWQKVMTRKVVFLTNGEELVQKLESLSIYTK